MIAYDLGPKILSARVICADNRGPKVLLCEDGEIVKYFRPGRSFSHLGYLGKADKFKKNARVIRRLGFRTPENIEVIDGIAGPNTAIRYRPVPGKEIRAVIQYGAAVAPLCVEVGKLMRVFHDNGVVFKANHLGNFIYKAGEPLGVIDFDNLYKLPFRLPGKMRTDNLLRLLRRDIGVIQTEAVLEGYVGERGNPNVESIVARVQRESAEFACS